MRRGNLAERTAPDGWILHCVQNDIKESASTAHKPPRVIASASVAISREGNETTAHTTKTKKQKKINIGIKFFRKGLYSDTDKNDEKERFDYFNSRDGCCLDCISHHRYIRLVLGASTSNRR